ncbi:hypothetical protein SO694_00006610 [Aureococcus anophagefferens]|uniref:Uncharacterized protein n=1 Tax=Aureococcus anophagefferens TaxID=44056 RepID=A0ABR1GAR4_AURAN
MMLLLRCVFVVAALADAASECADSTSWERKSKGCSWVEKKAKRCKKKDEYKVPARDACVEACGTCIEEEVACEGDSSSWFAKKPKRNCDYVAKKAKRCSREDSAGVPATVACPCSCEEDEDVAHAEEAPAPTPRPSDAPAPAPTAAPAPAPSAPGAPPVARATAAPSVTPTAAPSSPPSPLPSATPAPTSTPAPSRAPSLSSAPSSLPSSNPSTSLPSTAAPSPCPTVTPVPSTTTVAFTQLPEYFFLDGSSADIAFQFTTAAALYDSGEVTDVSYLVDVVLVDGDGAVVDFLAHAEQLESPYFFKEDYVPGSDLAYGRTLTEGWYTVKVMEYRAGYAAESRPVLMTSTPFPTPRPTVHPTSPAPSAAPTSTPTSEPTSDTIHAQMTVLSPERRGRVIEFTEPGQRIRDGLVAAVDEFELAVTFTGATLRDAVVTVRLVSGDGATDESGVDPCGVIATTLCLGEDIANGEPMFYNTTIPRGVESGVYRLSLVWIPHDDVRPKPPATYVCTDDFLVVDAYPTRKPTGLPVPAPTA